MPARPHPLSSVRWAAAIVLTLGLLCAIFALASDGIHEDDDLWHFLMARSAWTHPAYLLDVWGRPGFTLPHALVAPLGSMAFGFAACRVLSAILFTLSAWLTFLTARRLRCPYPVIAPLAMMLMPLPFYLSSVPKTETAAGLYAIAATYLLVRGRRRWACLVLALLPVTRHELAVLLVPIALYALLRRDILSALFLGWAELAWNLLSALAGLPLPIWRYLTKTDPGNLGRGDWLHYADRWLEMAGLTGVALTLAGIAVILIRHFRRAGRLRILLAPGQSARRARVRLFIAFSAIGLVALHTLLFVFNSFASGGYARFLLPAAPWMALCIAYGIAPLIRSAASIPSRMPRPVPSSPVAPAPVSSRPVPRRASLAYRNALWLFAAGILILSCWSRAYILIDMTIRLIPIAALLVAFIYPHRHTAALALLALGMLAIVQWGAFLHPHFIEPHQALMRETIPRLRAEFPDYTITGPSPWVHYLLERPLDAPDPPAAFRAWQSPGPAPRLIYILDQSHANWVATRLKVEAYPHVLLATLRSTAQEIEPYLRIYKRMPDGDKTPRAGNASVP